MCGICGAWHVESRDLEASLRASMAALTHRGPDGEGMHIEPGVALGMRRLAVIDVEGGQQPVWNEGKDVAVIMNGEIYNYVELLAEAKNAGHAVASRSDTEAAVHVYEDDGLSFVDRLRGMFAVVVFDRRRRRLVLARDRFGKKPLYYYRTSDGGLLFASEIKGLLPLLRGAGITPEIDPQSIYDYLSLGSVPQPATVYQNVVALPPGSRLVADDQGIRVEDYWTPMFAPKLSIDYREAQERVRAAIAEAVRIRLRSDVPLGVFLSSGIDSSIVAYEAARQVGASLRTFTVATDDPSTDESAVAARTAARLGVENTVLPLLVDPLRDLDALVRQYDQPFADPSAIPSMEISRLARRHVTVVLNGDGGDELFGGYRRYVAARLLARLGWFPRGASRRLAEWLRPEARSRRSPLGLAGRLFRGLGLEPEARYLVWTSDMLFDADKRDAWRASLSPRATESLVSEAMPHGGSPLDRQIGTELGLNLPSSLLVKMDIATSAASLEGRSPFMDQELGEIALRLPDSFRVRGRRTKAVLRDAYADVLPQEVLSGGKRGFEIPLATWLARDWREVVGDTLGASDARVRGFVDEALIDQAMQGDGFPQRNGAYITYAFLVLELWLRSIES